MEGRTMLELEAVNVFYDDAQVLWDVSLEVRPKEICTLVGANGAGKTSLLKAVCGLVPVSSGRVSLLGRDLLSVAANQRVSMGLSMVPEGRKIFASMTVEENLKIGSYVKKTWHEKEELLEKINYYLYSKK